MRWKPDQPSPRTNELAISATILASFTIFQGDVALAGYGIALAGLGLLSVTGYILAMDTFGPIVDNANGIFEMSRVGGEEPGRIIAHLDQAGNTTKAHSWVRLA